MTPLELKKLKVELKRVEAARAEMELRIDECNEQIERVLEQIKIQTNRESELTVMISKEEETKQ